MPEPLQSPFVLPSEHAYLQDIDRFIAPATQAVTGHLGALCLRSHFQPVYSLAHQRAVGFEALLRPQHDDGRALSPPAFFGMAGNREETVFLDRLCRTLHLRNFMMQDDGLSWLFLNIDPGVVTGGRQYGAFFAELLQRHGMPPHRVVVEILEGQIGDEGLLAEAVHYYKEMGCLIAIDDFGAGHSNFERIWRMAPQIVKLDRSTIVQAVENRTLSRVMPSLVSLIHEAGSLALVEGIETEAQALIALEADADFVQGYYFGRPAAQLPVDLRHEGIGQLFARCDDSAARPRGQAQLQRHVEAFQALAQQVRAGMEPQQAVQPFLALPQVERCYLLDHRGMQHGGNLLAPQAAAAVDPRFAPLDDARQAVWSRRHYFRKAVREPGTVHVSKPYLSITGGQLCVTLSMALAHAHVPGALVLCGDLLWQD